MESTGNYRKRNQLHFDHQHLWYLNLSPPALSHLSYKNSIISSSHINLQSYNMAIPLLTITPSKSCQIWRNVSTVAGWRWTNGDWSPVWQQPALKLIIIPCVLSLHGLWNALENPSLHLKNLSKSQVDLSRESFFFFLNLAKPHCKCLAAAWLHRKLKKKYVWMLNWPVCCPSMSPPSKCFGTSWKIKRPTSVDYLKSRIVQGWENKK